MSRGKKYWKKLTKTETNERKKSKQMNNKWYLTLSWRRPLSYRNQFIDLRSKSMDLFLYDNGLRHERVKVKVCKWNLCNSTDPSQMKMSFHFFPKSVVLRKTSLNMCVLKYKIKNPRILRVCDITKKYLIFQIVQKFG